MVSLPIIIGRFVECAITRQTARRQASPDRFGHLLKARERKKVDLLHGEIAVDELAVKTIRSLG